MSTRQGGRLVPSPPALAHPPRGAVSALNDLSRVVPPAGEAAGDAVAAQKGRRRRRGRKGVAGQLLGGKGAHGQHAIAGETPEALLLMVVVVVRLVMMMTMTISSSPSPLPQRPDAKVVGPVLFGAHHQAELAGLRGQLGVDDAS